MIRINENFLKLKSSYLFSEIAKRTQKCQEQHPELQIIKLGIGDVTRALPEACIAAFHHAVDEMADDATFRGYGPSQGYSFLREKIAANDYQARGAEISADEIFISDGAKSDTGNIQEIFAQSTKIAIPDPVYPVYVDSNVMAGRSGDHENGRYAGFVYMESTEKSNFIPALPEEPVDLIYLCFPNNPTGAVASRAELKKWVDYAREYKALIFFDAAYEAFVRDPQIPRSIYEIEGAAEVAIESRSFSKTAGFTGTRCAFTVIPKNCMAWDESGNRHALHALWDRRHSTKYNGLSYPLQRAAEAVYSDEGKEQCKTLVNYYLENARLVRHAMQELGYKCVGGDNSPYIWVNTGGDWEFFDMILSNTGVVTTPGIGFGRCGQGYTRISAFNSREMVREALERISRALQ